MVVTLQTRDIVGADGGWWYVMSSDLVCLKRVSG